MLSCPHPCLPHGGGCGGELVVGLRNLPETSAKQGQQKVLSFCSEHRVGRTTCLGFQPAAGSPALALRTSGHVPGPFCCAVLLIFLVMFSVNWKCYGVTSSSLEGDTGICVDCRELLWPHGSGHQKGSWVGMGNGWVTYTSRWVLLPRLHQADADSSVLGVGTGECRHGLEGRKGTEVSLSSVQ